MVNTKLLWTVCVATVFAVALSQQAGAQFHPQRTTYLTFSQPANPLVLAMFGAFWIVSSVFITILASWTLDSSESGTRVSTLEPAREDDAIARQEAA